MFDMSRTWDKTEKPNLNRWLDLKLRLPRYQTSALIAEYEDSPRANSWLIYQASIFIILITLYLGGVFYSEINCRVKTKAMFTRIVLHDDTKSYPAVRYEHHISGNKLKSAYNLKIINISMRFQTARIRLNGALMSYPADWEAYTSIIRLSSHGNELLFDQLKTFHRTFRSHRALRYFRCVHTELWTPRRLNICTVKVVPCELNSQTYELSTSRKFVRWRLKIA